MENDDEGHVSRRAAAKLLTGATAGTLASRAIAETNDASSVTSLMIRKLSIIETVRQMRASYGWHASRGDIDRVCELFATNGLFELLYKGKRRRLDGREEIRNFLNSTMAPDMVCPLIHNDTLVVADDCRHAVGTCVMETRASLQGAKSIIGYYHDRIVLSDGAWKFGARRYFLYSPVFERSGLDMLGEPEGGLAAWHDRKIGER